MHIDTDVLIWAMRGNADAMQALQEADTLEMSAVAYMEFVQGCRNKVELTRFKSAIDEIGVMVIDISEPISQRAVKLVEKFALSHSLHMADAIVAATAIVNKSSLLTGNIKHYAAIEGIEIVAFRP